ncbi:hypothetical protein [Schaalia sp. ZJ1691]|uniref:hypothetical protein n=1 Tax=Schaalia sp. ZJ1691 TaxID=2709404 RepID=UPI0013EB7FE9|nr:hypothetical protein [Schaalia sp. ZJ1691]
MQSAGYSAVHALGQGIYALTPLGEVPTVVSDDVHTARVRLAELPGSAAVVFTGPEAPGQAPNNASVTWERTGESLPFPPVASDLVLVNEHAYQIIPPRLLDDLSNGQGLFEAEVALLAIQWFLALSGVSVVLLPHSHWEVPAPGSPRELQRRVASLDALVSVFMEGPDRERASVSLHVALASAQVGQVMGGEGPSSSSPECGTEAMSAHTRTHHLTDLRRHVLANRRITAWAARDLSRRADRAICQYAGPLAQAYAATMSTLSASRTPTAESLTPVTSPQPASSPTSHREDESATEGLPGSNDLGNRVLVILPSGDAQALARCDGLEGVLEASEASVTRVNVPDDDTRGLLAEDFDAVVFLGTTLSMFPQVVTSKIPVAADLTPTPILDTFFAADRGMDPSPELRLLLERADFTIAPTQSERDFLLGMLAGTRRISTESYDEDPSLDSFIAVDPDGVQLAGFCAAPRRWAGVTSTFFPNRGAQSNVAQKAMLYLGVGSSTQRLGR